MKLLLKRVAPVRGIYARAGKQDVFPDRMAFLAPDAAESLAELERDTGGLRYSDMFRSAEASLAAVQEGRGAQSPAYSGHNYGLAVDVDVETILAEKRWKFRQLVDAMESHGWYCYCRDGKRGNEDWHFNYLGDDASSILPRLGSRATWKNAAELAIQARYGGQLSLTAVEVQEALRKLRLYSGAVDGVYGPLTKQAIDAFTRTWNLPSGTGPRFERTLAYVTADREVVGGSPTV